MSSRLSHVSKGVAHHSPGRTRIKVPKAHRHRMHEIKKELEKKPGVKQVELNQDTGSVLVHHDHDMPIFEVLHKTVEAVETELLTALVEGEAVEVLSGAGLIAAGMGLLGMVAKAFLGERGAASGGAGKSLIPLKGQASDLKTVVPTAFLAAAIFKAYETRSFWHGITPLALAYWAFDTYWRFNIANPSVFDQPNGKGNGNGSHLEAESHHKKDGNGHGHSHGHGN